ncbi:MAG: hypothetical protein ACR2QO_20710 [Acidimicrobiales bacterium]
MLFELDDAVPVEQKDVARNNVISALGESSRRQSSDRWPIRS